MYFTLHVRVVEANDIPKMDIITDTDAYCILNTGSETRKTFTVQNSKHPRWNQEFHFNVTSPTAGSLGITMRDEDVIKDDNISHIDIPYCSLPVGQVIDQWYNMTPFRKVKKGGRLHLVLHMSRAGQQPFVPSNAAFPQAGVMAPGCQAQSVYMMPAFPQQQTYTGTILCYPQQPIYPQQPCYPQQPAYPQQQAYPQQPAFHQQPQPQVYPPQQGFVQQGPPYMQPGFATQPPAFYQGYPPRY